MSPSPKKPSDSEDPWENLAEQLFGTTPGKEHTAANETRSGEARKDPPRKESRPLETLLGEDDSAEQAKKKKSLAELLFDDESEETPDEGAPPGEEPAAPVRAGGKKPLLDDDDDSAEPDESGLELPTPKPATVSPQDSYWDALANWSWDDGDASKSSGSAAEPASELSEPAAERTSPSERSPSGSSGRGGRRWVR